MWGVQSPCGVFPSAQTHVSFAARALARPRFMCSPSLSRHCCFRRETSLELTCILSPERLWSTLASNGEYKGSRTWPSPAPAALATDGAQSSTSPSSPLHTC
ncbi:hypothetical protein SKAU_G00175320 [Synaphobranchus kaupii]|uniref:Uncharacterized protein n=1 Tax=Synaphobranchus kaupii TaxID=118154 RepID=A0A9Q1J190_SYNKA|nr:hypothetical protein SKAU_G00175320 [Synaphobranchus kaupii]